jgi:hypothetical protein
MTATTSLVPEVIDYLFATATASASLGAASPQVYVFDGPQPSRALSGVQRALWIGHDPAAEGEPAATATQDWPNLDQARTLDEDGEITCAAQHWSGDTTVKVHRDGCNAIIAAVQLMLRGTTISGGPGDTQMGGLVFWSSVAGPYQWYPAQATNGAAVLCVFKIVYRARLVSS